MGSGFFRDTRSRRSTAFSKAVTLLLAGIGVLALAACILKAQESKKPLTKGAVLGLLHGDVPPKRVGEVARDQGITFPMTPETEKELRDAGADEGLLKVLRKLAPPPPTPRQESGKSPVLMIQSTPGDAQVYIDDEPVGTTSSEGRLKLSHLTAGEHRLRLSLSGYGDFEETVQIAAGQTVNVNAKLESRGTSNSAAAIPSSASQLAASLTDSAASANAPPASQVAAGLTDSTTPATAPPAVPSLVSFLVVHDHGQGVSGTNFCVGSMSVGNGLISYKGLRGNPVHSFDLQLNTVKEAKKNGAYLMAIGGFHIRLKKGTNFNFVTINEAAQFQPPDALLEAIDKALQAAPR